MKEDSKIIFTQNPFGELKKIIETEYPNSKEVFITDRNVGELYKAEITKYFPKANVFALVPGNEHKSIESVLGLANELIKEGFTKNDIIVGFGGGTITDLSGFLASIYRQGVKHIAIPSSIIGMTQASVSGKTGVVFSEENGLGSNHISEKILINEGFIKTLPKEELEKGIMEIKKIKPELSKELDKKEINWKEMIQKAIQKKN